jgi:3-hydroxybutyrate dehydrogenase
MKTALITGSTSGIGLGIAREFASAGYAIMFNGLEANGADIAAEVGKTYGVQTAFSNANLLRTEEIKAMVANAEQTFGSVDVLVNNAGVQFVAPVDEFPEEKWHFILGVNLHAVFFASQAVWAGMKQRKHGRIINISSAHGLVASEFKSAYVAAKHGVTGLTKVLALEGGPYNITCNAICPGYVRTPLVEGQIKDQAKVHNMPEERVISDIMLKQHAIKEFVPVESIGKLAVFLASEAAGQITGASLPMEAGWTAR